MPLDTIEAVTVRYVENMGYAANNSAAEAKLFIAALQELMLRRPVSAVVDGNSVRFDYTALKNELSYARAWLANNDTTSNGGSSGVYTYDMSNLRE